MSKLIKLYMFNVWSFFVWFGFACQAHLNKTVREREREKLISGGKEMFGDLETGLCTTLVHVTGDEAPEQIMTMGKEQREGVQ